MTKKARAETQLFRLTQLLSDPSNKSGIVTKADIVAKLGIQDSSVPVYIHSLKKKYGAKIENVIEGRSVTGYMLMNDIDVPQFKRSAVTPTPSKPKPSVTTDDLSVPILDTGTDEYTDSEHRDIESMLGYSNRGDY
jgi:hypothetical protein